MIEEPFPDDERRRLLFLAIAAIPLDRPADEQLLRIVNRLSGTDTRLIVQRSRPSRAAVINHRHDDGKDDRRGDLE